MRIHSHSYDAVVVGAGGAGLRAAIETAGKCRVAVLTKLYPTRSHTGAAQGGMCAALANVEEDSWEWHAFDTVKGSDYLGDQPAIEIMCREAIDAVIQLEHWGLPFNRTPEGKIDQRRFGGHTRNHGEAPVRRACYAADRTGHMILQTLYQQCIKRNVRFFNEFYCLDLLMEDGRCAGIVAYELATGEVHVFRAKAVLFATGGFGRVFKITSNAHALTGDGPARADPTDRALCDGRHPDEHRRPGRARIRRDARARVVRGRGVRLRLRPRSEPARNELAARHRRVRPARRSSHGHLRARCRA